MGNSRGLQRRHEKLWADEVVDLQYRLLLTNEIADMDPPTNYKPSFHGIHVCRLLKAEELDELCGRGSSNRSGHRSSDGSTQSS